MAKPKVMKVSGFYKLMDLYLSGKVKDGDKVCFTVPTNKKDRRKFVCGTLFASYVKYCECCGPIFRASVKKADGTVVMKWR